MKKICLFLAIIMLSYPLSSFAEVIDILPAPEFEFVVLDKLDENMAIDDEIKTPDEGIDKDDDTSQDKDLVEDLPSDNEFVEENDPDIDEFPNDESQDDDILPKDEMDEESIYDSGEDALDKEQSDEHSSDNDPEEKDFPDADNKEADPEKDAEDCTEGKEQNEEDIKIAPDDEDETKENYNEIVLLSIPALTPPAIDNVYVDAYAGIAEILVSGVELDGVTIGMKIVPIGNESEIVYVRQIMIDSYGGCIAVADLSGSSSQLFKLTVEAGDLGRFERIFTCGEAEKLKCTRTVSNIKIEATADIPTEQIIAIKVLSIDGEVKYVCQKKTNSDGSYSVNIPLPTDDEYIVYVTEGKTGRQFIKTVDTKISSENQFSSKQTISGSAGEYKEAVVCAKNITDISKYIYEIEYDSSVLSVKNINPLLESNIKIVSFDRGCVAFTSSNRNIAGHLWTGTINVVQFELLRDTDKTEISLNIYESED